MNPGIPNYSTLEAHMRTGNVVKLRIPSQEAVAKCIGYAAGVVFLTAVTISAVVQCLLYKAGRAIRLVPN